MCWFCTRRGESRETRCRGNTGRKVGEELQEWIEGKDSDKENIGGRKKLGPLERSTSCFMGRVNSKLKVKLGIKRLASLTDEYFRRLNF